MAYNRKPNYHFKTKNDTGIDKVPVGRQIIIEDYDGDGSGIIKRFTKKGNLGIDSISTIGDAINNEMVIPDQDIIDIKNDTYTKNDVDGIIIDVKKRTISPIASSVISNHNTAVSLSNTVQTKNHVVITYTGNGSSQDITTGISSVDFTQPNNGSGYYNKRVGNGFAVIADDAVDLIDSTNDTSSVDNWSAYNDANLSVSNGVLSVNADTTDTPYASQTITGLDATKYYLVSVEGHGTNALLNVFNKNGNTTSTLSNLDGYGGQVLQPRSDGTFKLDLKMWGTGDDDTATFSNLSILPVAENGSGTCVVNTSKVHIKSRNDDLYNTIVDGLRGGGNQLCTNNSIDEKSDDRYSFGTGFTLKTDNNNNDDVTFVLYQTLYTHIKWGTTSHNKFYVEAYNPVTRESMIMYEGSGSIGHKIPHSLGVGLDYSAIKCLSMTSTGWLSNRYGTTSCLYLNMDNAEDSNYTTNIFSEKNTIVLETDRTAQNSTNASYILYGKAKSETWTVGTYTGTGSKFNIIPVHDVNGKPVKLRDVVIKRIDDVGDWRILNTKTEMNNYTLLNAKTKEVDSGNDDNVYIGSLKIMSTDSHVNALKGQYLYMGYIDTNADATPDDSYFNKTIDSSSADSTDTVITENAHTAGELIKDENGIIYKALVDTAQGDLLTDTSRFQGLSGLTINAGNFLLTTGKNSNGFEVITQEFHGTIDASNAEDGINWVGRDVNGNWVFSKDKPSYGMYKKEHADDNRMIFDKDAGKWYSATGGNLVVNGDFNDDIIYNDYFRSEGGLLKVNTTGNKSVGFAVSTIPGEKYVVEGRISCESGTLIKLESYFALAEDFIVSAGDSRKVRGIVTSSSSTEEPLVVWGIDSAIGTVDNISVYKLEPTLDQEVPAISWLKYPYMVASGTIVSEVRN